MKHVCPVSKCKKSVVHLPRHLRAVHKWSPTKSNSALSIFDIRKKSDKIAKGNKPARIYRRRVCPFIGCSAVVRRLHNHLTGKHKLKREDERYGWYNAPQVLLVLTSKVYNISKRWHFTHPYCFLFIVYKIIKESLLWSIWLVSWSIWSMSAYVMSMNVCNFSGVLQSK